MSAPLSRLAVQAAYGARQLPRVAWYVAHNVAMRRILARLPATREPSRRPPAHTDAPVPGRQRLFADIARLLKLDLANVEVGIYPVPLDHDGSVLTLLRRSRLFFEDLPAVERRRKLDRRQEVLTQASQAKRPDYYLQNFHFQSGGWMTLDSARRYDIQVEVLFHGTANITRRQALPPLAQAFAGRDQRKLRLLDVGCGTGRFLDCVKQVWPRIPAYGVDLSEAYIEEARAFLNRWSRLKLTVGNAELLPVADASFDAVSTIFVMHELPEKVRVGTFREFARVLKPGGRLVVVDSLQRGDEPDYDGLLELFPQNFHEPYYLSYIGQDFISLAKAHGLKHVRTSLAFISKIMVFDKLA